MERKESMADTDVIAQSKPSPAQGRCDEGFEGVRRLFEEQLGAEAHLGAQVCAYVGGRCVLDLWGGEDAERDGIQGIFSSTKGVSASVVGLLVEAGELDLDQRVAHYWPDFAQAGKNEVTVRCALSHQAGVVGFFPMLSFDDLLDHDLVATRLSALTPHWRPGAGHGYHGFTIGTLMDELVRRVTGRPLGEVLRSEIVDVLGADVFVGVSADEDHRVKPVLMDRRDDAVEADSRRSDPEIASAVPRPSRLSVADMARFANTPAARAAGLPAAGGVASARGLARLYAAITTGVDGRPALLRPRTVEYVSQTQAVGEDLVLGIPTRYAIVYQRTSTTHPYGSYLAFGHDGAGGSLALADPAYGCSFAYLQRRMPVQLGYHARAIALATTLRGCVRASASGGWG
jgi:CubicO group peptidase (beta-lactamase class C family)